MSVVCLLTDFGLSDNYVGVMKGVLLRQAPEIALVDLTHDVHPQNVPAAAFQLMTAAAYFPEGTLFLCVVDPGVGSARGILYAEAGGYRFLAPDNGLLSWVFDPFPPSKVMQIDLPTLAGGEISGTFHGRDIFAPVAGRILRGENPAQFSRVTNEWVKIPFPKVEKAGSKWTAEILHVDKFGNLITNLASKELLPLADASKIWFDLGDQSPTIRGLVSSYSSVEKGRLLALPGSHGFIEISVRDGSAAGKTHLAESSRITVHFRI